MKLDELVAVYCPLYHPHPHASAWYGEGWTEWELIRNAPPRFEGHHQPLLSPLGYFHEAHPKTPAPRDRSFRRPWHHRFPRRLVLAQRRANHAKTARGWILESSEPSAP